MSRSVDPGHFFQTESALSEIERKATKANNNEGKPIRLTSKLLAVVNDPTNIRRVFVAESAACVRRVDLDNGNKSHVYVGPSAPVTCIALSGERVFAGSWDKSIYSWNIENRRLTKKYHGHTDFVKTVYCCSINETGKVVLVSGGADAIIMVWDIETGSKLHILKGHIRGVQDLISIPSGIPDSSSFILMSAGSVGEVKVWTISESTASEEKDQEVISHATTIHKLRIDDVECDEHGAFKAVTLWTASADKTAKSLSLDVGGKGSIWREDTTFTHPDFVNDVVLIGNNTGYVATGCRDEEIRIWNQSTGELVHTFSGHFEEVTGLAVSQSSDTGHLLLVSVSIDCTIRQWPVRPVDIQEAILKEEERKKGLVDESAKKPSLLTEEEERELTELMDDSN